MGQAAALNTLCAVAGAPAHVGRALLAVHTAAVAALAAAAALTTGARVLFLLCGCVALPSRTKWTRLVPPLVLIRRVTSAPHAT